MNKKYTNEKLLNELYRFIEENGRIPNKEDMNKKNGYPCATTYQKYFGTWSNVLIVANLPLNKVAKYEKEELLQLLMEFYHTHGRSPKKLELKKYNMPSKSVYELYFGTWNNALRTCGLPLNTERHKIIGDRICTICSTAQSSQWNIINDKLICKNCYTRNRKYLHGRLSPNSSAGKGYITEYVVSQILDNCTMNNIKNNFNAPFDLTSDCLGSLDVKSSHLIRCRGHENGEWSFKIGKYIPNYYVCIGLNDKWTVIEKVWIFPKNCNIISKTGISITNSKKGLKRVEKYEVDSTPYNNLYQHLNIYDLFPFKNLDILEEVSV